MSFLSRLAVSSDAETFDAGTGAYCVDSKAALARFARENLLPAVVNLTRFATNYFRALGRREATERNQMPANEESQLKIVK